MAINYNFDSKNETAAQYNTRIDKERSGVNSTTTPLAPLPATEGAADRVNKFNAALNKAVDEARKQRKDVTMDFMEGVVPPGALKATSMAGVLSAFNSDSAPLEASLLNNASQFAQDAAMSEMKTKSSIQELALKVAENGGSTDVVSAILTFTESGDMDGALKAASAALGTEVTQVGSNLVRIDKKTGEYEVLYTAPVRTGGGGGGSKKKADEADADWEISNPLPKGMEGPAVEISGMDFYSAKTADLDREMGRVLGEKSPAIKKALTAELQRDFMNDWVFTQESEGRMIDPWSYYTDIWAPAAGISTKAPVTKEGEATTPEKRTPLAK